MIRKTIRAHLRAASLILLSILLLCGCGKERDDSVVTSVTQGKHELAPASEQEPAQEAQPEERQYAVRVGQSFRLIELAAEHNGENGVTFYYTQDGRTLTPFTDWDAKDGKWLHGTEGVLAYPAVAPQDNYTAAGTSASEYVAVGFEAPETGAAELKVWLALQGPSGEHGYRVRVCADGASDEADSFDLTGDTQTVAEHTFGLKVTKGGEVLLMFEPLVRKDFEWFGFKAELTYTGLGPDAVPTQPTNVPPDASQLKDPDDGVRKILCIGNSFTVDMLEYAAKIAHSAGVTDFLIGKAVIPGATIEMHAENARQNAAAYEFGVSTADGGWRTEYGRSLRDVLLAENWDWIVVQEWSGGTFRDYASGDNTPKTYEDLESLLDHIERYTRPEAQHAFHMTWAYQNDSTHEMFALFDNDQMTMYNAIIRMTQSVIVPNARIDRIIPCGTAIQNARTSYLGDAITLDGYHMNHWEGRYTAAMTFARTMLDVDLSRVTYRPAGVSELWRQTAVEAVQNAVDDPFSVTPSTFTAERVDTSLEIHRSEQTFVSLSGSRNGADGLSFYYTGDGVTLTPYPAYDRPKSRWVDSTDGQLNMIRPREVVSRNWGEGQCSDTRYVALGYRAPETGELDLFVLTSIQSGSGECAFNVRIALGTPDNTVHQYTVAGSPGVTQEERYTLAVTAGDEIFILYDNLGVAGTFGYRNTVTYRTQT